MRHTVGPARRWHFSINLLWILNGVAFYGLLFATDQWLRLVPTTWTVFPNAFSVLIQYWSLHFPADHSWTNYNALQQLTYFVTVFIAAPVQIGTGLMQRPAIANKLGWLGRPFNRQRARTIHFLGLLWFVFFILIHGVLVFITAARPKGKKTLPLSGDADKLQPMTETGGGSLNEKEKALLREIIQKVNDLFTGELTDDDRLVYVNSLKSKLLASETLVQQATNNTKTQFAASPDLSKQFINAVMDALEVYNTMGEQTLASERIQKGLLDTLLGLAQLYEALRARGEELKGR